MKTIEICFLIGKRGKILWSDSGASAVSIPDSRARWEAIWERRAGLTEIAHSHPVGPLGFSHEDETTMQALGSALGKTLRFSVVAPDGMIRRENGADRLLKKEPAWTAKLRRLSGIPSRSKKKRKE